ncbi:MULTISPECIES: VOC family protein [unclassified Paraburkholderia]|uniref:VOC family protein n=1 Tax=unclassified Paraburkholderia TaxID=2615204 RepID=UPI002AB254C9|nr:MULTISPECIES: VOC family protein [unclassified Paraburkholderia]
MSNTAPRPTFGSAVYYRDPFAALDWLEKAFGFTRQFVVTTPDGKLAHSEMRFQDGYVMICGGWPGMAYSSPADVEGKNTQSVHVQLVSDLDAHCARARAAGAKIAREPSDQFYGDRVYAAMDPEGHVWSFGQTTREVSREEAEQASGLKIDGWV